MSSNHWPSKTATHSTLDKDGNWLASEGSRSASEAPSDAELLALVRGEATKFGRCCDLYQDSLGTFADHECQQRTFAMLASVQSVLGFDKGGGPLSDEEIISARNRARLNNAAADMQSALIKLNAALDAMWNDNHRDMKMNRSRHEIEICNAQKECAAIIAKTEGR